MSNETNDDRFQKKQAQFLFNYQVIRSNQNLISLIKNIYILLFKKNLDYLYCKWGKVKYHQVLTEHEPQGDFLQMIHSYSKDDRSHES